MRRLVGLSLLLALPLLFGITLLIPLDFPEESGPARVYAKPHRIEAGQSLERSGLVARLERLGYRKVAQRRPRRGEVRITPRRIVLNPRSPATADGRGPGPVEVRIDRRGRIAEILAPQGSRLRHLTLEPELVGVFQGSEHVDRHPIAFAAVPDHFVQAVLGVEDRRFFEHGAIDLRRLAGALVANLRSGEIRQGGSTLTQQLAKNLYLNPQRTLGRKLREAWLALRIERTYGKREILEYYLNTIYLGQRGSASVRGVEAAARHYFGKHVAELSLAESALLAGLIRGPGLYSPFSHPERALKRRDQVLRLLQADGRITAAEYAAALAEPLGALQRPAEPIVAPYRIAWLERELARDLPDVDLERSALSIQTGLDAQLQLYAQRALRRGLSKLERGRPRLLEAPSPLQAALLVLDPADGSVLAHVGGRDWSRSQFDRAMQAHRQPGSVFKPIVALAALARGPDGTPAFTLASHLDDAPLSLETPEGFWTPTNHAGEFRGLVSLRTALEDSINVPIVRLGLGVGAPRIVATARRLGLRSRLALVPSVALGAFEVSPFEIANAYAVFASGGQRLEAPSYLSVRDEAGRELRSATPTRERVFARAEVALVTSALRGVVDRGTARSLRGLGFHGPVAGKTGTTNGSRDAWFVGYTPELVAAVWVGFDDARGLGLSGAQAALPIFADFIIQALGPAGGARFPAVPGLEEVRIHTDSGLRARLGCWGQGEIFLTGTAPHEFCRPWQRVARGAGAARGPHPVGEAPPTPAGLPPIGRLLGALLDLVEGFVEELDQRP